MFKKFLNDLLGGDDENKKKNNQTGEQNQQRQQQANEDEEYDEDEEEYSDEDDDGDPYYTPPSSTDLDPVTLHGKHYTEAQFDAEVERRVADVIKDENEEGNTLDEREIDNWRFNIRRDVYKEWTGANENQLTQWESANMLKNQGFVMFGYEKHDDNNPLLAPIHGVTLQDYGAMASKIASGVPAEALCKALNIEKPVWDEANTLWVKRMQEDGTFTVTNLFSRYFGEANQHPVLGGITATSGDGNQDNISKINNDRYYYEELCGARQAAYEYGIDGAQWILDNFGIPLGEFQNAAMKWMQEQNLNFDHQKINHFIDYQQQKQKEYAAKFAAEQGGNVADDVEF